MKTLLAILMMNSCINLACQPTVCKPALLVDLPAAPSLVYAAGTLTVTNNDPGSLDSYDVWHKPDGVATFALFSSSPTAHTFSSAAFGDWIARVKIAGVYSPFTDRVTVAGSTSPDFTGAPATGLAWDLPNWQLVTNWSAAVTPDGYRLYQSFNDGTVWVLTAENTTGVFAPPDFEAQKNTFLIVTAVYQGTESANDLEAVINFVVLPPTMRCTEDSQRRATEDGGPILSDLPGAPSYVPPPFSPVNWSVGTGGASLPGGHIFSPP